MLSNLYNKYFRFKNHKLILCTTFISFLGFIVISYNLYTFFLFPINASNTVVTYKVPQGASFKSIIKNLNASKEFCIPKSFEIFVTLSGQRSKLQAGEYSIEPRLSANQLLKKMLMGDVVQKSFTILGGQSFTEILYNIKHCPDLVFTLEGKSMQEIAQIVGVPSVSVEGWLLPETYHFASGISDVDFIKTAYGHMQDKLNAAWENRGPNLIYKDKYQALVMASIIEKETSIDREYCDIAAVFLGRISNNMRLQADPTVIYGTRFLITKGFDTGFLDKLEKFDVAITKTQLKLDTPYNTYTRRGLPPTPIAMPSSKAIEAALHPSKTDALYFVADGKGGHVFSSSLAEHADAVLKYRANKIVNK